MHEALSTCSNTAWSQAANSYFYVMATAEPGILSSGPGNGPTIVAETGAGPWACFRLRFSLLSAFNVLRNLS